MYKQIFLLKLQAPGSYDHGLEPVRGMVVVAGSDTRARITASRAAGDEGAEAWLGTVRSVCTRIGRAKSTTKAGVILRDQLTR